MSRVPSSCGSEALRCSETMVMVCGWNHDNYISWHPAVTTSRRPGLKQVLELPTSGLPQAPVSLTGSTASPSRALTQVTLDPWGMVRRLSKHNEFKGIHFRASISGGTGSWPHVGFPFPRSSFKNSPSSTMQKQDTFTFHTLTTGEEKISWAPNKDDSKIYFGQSFLEEIIRHERPTLALEVFPGLLEIAVKHEAGDLYGEFCPSLGCSKLRHIVECGQWGGKQVWLNFCLMV